MNTTFFEWEGKRATQMQVNYSSFSVPVIPCPLFGYDMSIVGLSGMAHTHV
jgi:hypothetical protein